jgi:hypothetical protein
MDFVYEKHTRNDFGFAFFFPLADFGVDLVTDFTSDFARVTGEEGEETLGSGVYYVDFMKGDGMDYFLAFLEVSIWAL